MDGLMMDYPLTLVHILERVREFFGRVEVVSRLPDRSMHRYTYADFYRRAKQLAKALTHAGIHRGDRVATLMWNQYQHLEAYFGIPACGAVVHTLNVRLHPDELGYIASHANDRFIIVDEGLLPLLEKFKVQASFGRVIVVRHRQGSMIGSYCDYEDFIALGKGDFSYPQLGENEAAALCFTSGTTGKPKGVLYSHRAIVLHSFALALADSSGLAQRDVVVAVAPMFHANSHGLPYVAVMLGAKLVLPGSHLDPDSLLELFELEKATFLSAVPTVWLGILGELDKNPTRWNLSGDLRGLGGGSAVSESLMFGLERHGIPVVQAWGMTELTPVGTVSSLKSYMEEWPEEQRRKVRCSQGRPIPFVEIRAIGAEGETAWDGHSLGELQVRGPWVARSYYNMPDESQRWTVDGWFRTGDVCTIDSEGFVTIVDRIKDMIKSGGEWISSVDLENAVMGYPNVQEAAVVAVPHPTWTERPLALIVCKDGEAVSTEDLLRYLRGRFSKWQLPDAVVFVKELPKTSTGKLFKKKLREQYRTWNWEKSGPDIN